ncbi:MAG: alpha/beta hydrolase [Pseudomonadota bacterium]
MSDGCPIHYFTWGNRANPALVFLHGRMSHARCWGFIAPALADQYYCIALDLSGMGDSGHRDTYTYAHRAREVLAVIRHAGVSTHPAKPLLVTHSYGAVVALQAHALAPEGFAGLIASDPSLHHPDTWNSLTPRTDGPALDRPHRTHASIDTIVNRFAFAPPQPCSYPVLKEYIAVHSAREVDAGWQWKFDPWVYSPREEGHNDWWLTHTRDLVSRDLHKIIIYAENSEFTGTDTTNSVAALSETIVNTVGIEDAYHHLMVDQPEQLVDSLRSSANQLLRLDASG